jgi:hypothetical protein
MSDFDASNLSLSEIAVALEQLARDAIHNADLTQAAAFAQAAGTYHCASALTQILELLANKDSIHAP